ncbi:helix-turn-helix domain-containing protein [Chitinophaga sp. Hz27]|uniref:helix-turn-helix domain-containing protein n=1 Tax=Chitinophaga sp. Hz27 TaxID=3347169 RepID=UPI0035DEF65F
MDEKKQILRRIGVTIQAIRKGKGMTQVDLEIATGIANQDISAIERGLVDLHFITLARIAKGLKVQVSDLYYIDYSEDGDTK